MKGLKAAFLISFVLASLPVSAKQVKLTKGNVSQLVKLTLKLAQSLDEKNADMLAEVSDAQLGIFFWSGECECVVPARHFSMNADKNKKEKFFDDIDMSAYYDAASKQLSQGVAVLGKEKEEPAKDAAESANIPFASVEGKKAAEDLTALLYPEEKCASDEGKAKNRDEEKKWLKKESIVEIKMLQGFKALNVFFRKQKNKFVVMHVISHAWCP